jgi:hypothetical protein
VALEGEFRREIGAMDLISLPNYNIYLKVMMMGKCRGRSAGSGSD